MKLATERSYIRSLRFSDLKEYHQLYSDPCTSIFEYSHQMNLIAAEEQLQISVQETEEDQSIPWELAIELKEPQKLIGTLRISTPVLEVEIPSIEYNISFSILTDFQNKGFATEVLRAFIRDSILERKIHRLTAKTDSKNTACIRVLEKSGMKKEATLRKHIELRDGSFQDELVFAILREDIIE